MKNDKIDIRQSIEKRRIIRETDASLFEKISDYLMYTFLVIVFPFIGIMNSLMQLKEGGSGSLTNALLFIGGSLVLGGMILYATLTLDKLRILRGINKKENRRIIKEIAQDFDWDIRIDEEDMTLASSKLEITSTSWGSDITFIYHQNDILINRTAYLLDGTKSPLHWIGNRLTKRAVRIKFEEKTENNDTPTRL